MLVGLDVSEGRHRHPISMTAGTDMHPERLPITLRRHRANWVYAPTPGISALPFQKQLPAP